MRQITDSNDFSRLMNIASRHVPLGGAPAGFIPFPYIYHSDATPFVDRRCYEFLQTLGSANNCSGFYVLMLEPNPLTYFYRHFKKLPAFEFAEGDTRDDYATMLFADPGDSPADAIGYRGDRFAIFPESVSWFVLADRATDAAIIGSNHALSKMPQFPLVTPDAEGWHNGSSA